MNQTKRRIFEKTMELFAKKGYDATSIEEITASVGVAKGTFYYHFETKEKLFSFLVKESVRLFSNSTIAKASKAKTLSEKVKAIILVQVKIVIKYENFIRMIASEMWGDEPRNIICREEARKYINTIEKIIVQAGEQEGKQIENSKMLADQIFGLLCSSLMYKLRDENEDKQILKLEMEYHVLKYIKLD
ncbi:MAG: TetR/AcrR family transcriptional regulator [Oscillospiraceae bacterium]|nr:TetR/AcrR family transcriptional regulator [Oscillospiraceae bacterium]